MFYRLVDRNATCGNLDCMTYSFTHQLSLSEDVNNFTVNLTFNSCFKTLKNLFPSLILREKICRMLLIQQKLSSRQRLTIPKVVSMLCFKQWFAKKKLDGDKNLAG